MRIEDFIIGENVLVNNDGNKTMENLNNHFDNIEKKIKHDDLSGMQGPMRSCHNGAAW
ncbi:hypothetical protein Bcsk_002790 [Bartonella sp. CDC_skunk]|uniref:Uncharacterized protein n=1 Tax=Bartonella rochalimae ATCC BAA-1498 TaxID=685782 RepID=E6YN04_9HYPH|nr:MULTISPECIES: hypothetical protein [Bartonella]AQX20939.1 hypothetical protein Bcsk_002790 [Bartonella sp. CDC_skunk]AQX22521.1 hypothetical protein Bho11B_004990 [Bartonella sp. 11B]AQX24197.1 hypothetical protein Bho114_008780 [Bartonella sp. 114]AQX24970.1 hypothetical protein Bco22_002730 [Bartonella sp. Coyote22sub2]AQX26198.1 hypothetical protein Bra60_001760 [Bartonella sp. Raccoon60]